MSPRPFGRPGHNPRRPDPQASVVIRAGKRPREPRSRPAPEQAPAPPATPAPSLLERDRQLAEAGVPLCPCCGERDKVSADGWCNRCNGWVTALSPPPG
jgi:hypothetical protein